MTRLAVVGCGTHSRKEHGECLAHYVAAHPDEVDLIATCDLRRDKAQSYCDEFGFKHAYDNVDRMLDEVKPHGCLCIMPIAKIALVSSQVLQRGVPCVIEKPPGASLIEARELARIAEQSNTSHMVSVNRRFWPHLNRASAWVKQHGPLRWARASVFRVGRREHDFLWTTAIHVIDALRHIAGEISSFDVQTVAGEELTAQWHVLSLRFAGRCVGQVSFLTTTGHQQEMFELAGEGCLARATLDVVTGCSQLRCWRNGVLEVAEDSPDDAPRTVTNGSYDENVAFIEALQGKRPMTPTLSDVLPSLELCAQIMEACR